MKVIFVCPGGITRRFGMWPERALARELIRLGAEVFAFTSKYIEIYDEKDIDEIDGVYVERYWGKRSRPTDLVRFMSRLLTLKCSLIHMHFPSYLNELADTSYMIAKLRNIPYVLTIHGILHDPYIVTNTDEPDFDSIHTDGVTWKFSDMIRKGGLFRDDVRRNYFSHVEISDADRIIALSNFEKQILTNRFGITDGKIEVIPNGVDLDFYRQMLPKIEAKKKIGFGEDSKILLFFGALTKRKGPIYLVKALPYILRRHPNTCSIFAGHVTGLKGEILRTAEQLGVRDKVSILENVPEEEKCDLFAASDVFVLPTLYEGFGITIIEAMACYRPVVSTRIPVVDEIVDDGKTGILVPPRDHVRLAEAIDYLLSHPEITESMGQAGRRKVELHFNWKNLARRTLQVYRDILSRSQEL